MGDLVPFPQRPERGEDWPWPMLRDMIEAAVKLSDGLPESAPATITARMKADTLHLIDGARGIASGVGPLERERLTLLVSEVIASRIYTEMEFERERRA